MPWPPGCGPRASTSTSATTVSTACGAAEEHDYAAILLDIMLPGMNGYRICARLRENGNDTPILHAHREDR